MRLAILFSLIAFPALADERDSFYGTWGDEKQCTRTLIKPNGTVAAAPFEISQGWLRHGNVWCRLNWFPIEARGNGKFTGAIAQCGEDSVRGYFLNMELSEKEELTLKWDFPLKNGPLARCAKP